MFNKDTGDYPIEFVATAQAPFFGVFSVAVSLHDPSFPALFSAGGNFPQPVPVIVDEVTTVTGPDELIDVVITERGVAINPRREDLLERVKGTDLPIKPIEQIKEEVEALVGGAPEPPSLGEEPVAVIKWVDGTLIDTVWRVVE